MRYMRVLVLGRRQLMASSLLFLQRCDESTSLLETISEERRHWDCDREISRSPLFVSYILISFSPSPDLSPPFIFLLFIRDDDLCVYIF